MQSRETRFWLRFESGERRGQEAPLFEGVSTLGRRTDNEVVVADASVSGRHARIEIRGGEARLDDLGSTNGTRVAGEKIDSRRLAHGDPLMLGTVRLVFLDALLDGSLDATSSVGSAAISSQAPADELARLGTERVTGAGRRSLWGAVLALVLAAGLFFVWRSRGGEDQRLRAAVVPTPGNLLTDASFEGADTSADWISADAASQSFYRDGAFAGSGEVGFGVVLEAGEWALARSPDVALRTRRGVELRARVRAEDAALGRVGLELTSSSGAGPTFIAWAPPVSATGSAFEDVVHSFDALPGYDRGRAVVAAHGAGAVSLDDVAVLVAESQRGSDATFLEYEARLLGDPASGAALVRTGRVLFFGVGFDAWGEQGLEGWTGARWTASATDAGLVLEANDVPADAVLRFGVNALRPPDAEGEGWVATIGPDGYRAHSSSFERQNATSLLLGRGIDLLRLSFERPVHVAGAIRNGALRVSLETGGLTRFPLQLAFHEERADASLLASRARESELDGEFGDAIGAWSELLDRHPFEVALNSEAEAALARLVRSGLGQLEEVRQEMERARFFGLAEIYRQCRRHARTTASVYGQGEVRDEAERLIAEIGRELEALDAEHSDVRTERLRGVLQTLDPNVDPLLYLRVRASIDRDTPESQRN